MAPTTPRPARSAVLIIRHGRVLLIERQKTGQPTYYVLPGGGLERGETPEQAAVREIKEELGVDITVIGREKSLSPNDREVWIVRAQLKSGSAPRWLEAYKQTPGNRYRAIWLTLAEAKNARVVPPDVINRLPVISLTNSRGHALTLTWIRSNRLNRYRPCTQAYGIVFNSQGEILIIQENGQWKIPGGTPEAGELPRQTLCRELMEEADVTIRQVLPLGVQKVEYPGNPHTAQGDSFYQYRYICRLEQLYESSPDPATGLIYPRRFVPAAEVTRYVQWGAVGEAMFADAVQLYREA